MKLRNNFVALESILIVRSENSEKGIVRRSGE
jgi:hypothetical protein